MENIYIPPSAFRFMTKNQKGVLRILKDEWKQMHPIRGELRLPNEFNEVDHNGIRIFRPIGD